MAEELSSVETGAGAAEEGDIVQVEQVAETKESAEMPAAEVEQAGGAAAAESDKEADKPAADKDKPAEKAESDKAAEKAKEDAAWQEFEQSLAGDDSFQGKVAGSFVKFARSQNLTVEQGKAAGEWLAAEIQAGREALAAQGREELVSEWGQRADNNRVKALAVVSMLDRQLDGGFSKAIDQSGIAYDARFVRGLYKLSELLGEDALGIAGGGSHAEKVESELEGITDAFRRARRGGNTY